MTKILVVSKHVLSDNIQPLQTVLHLYKQIIEQILHKEELVYHSRQEEVCFLSTPDTTAEHPYSLSYLLS